MAPQIILGLTAQDQVGVTTSCGDTVGMRDFFGEVSAYAQSD